MTWVAADTFTSPSATPADRAARSISAASLAQSMPCTRIRIGVEAVGNVLFSAWFMCDPLQSGEQKCRR